MVYSLFVFVPVGMGFAFVPVRYGFCVGSFMVSFTVSFLDTAILGPSLSLCTQNLKTETMRQGTRLIALRTVYVGLWFGITGHVGYG